MVHVALVGATGLVGKQILAQLAHLSSDLVLISVSNSRKTLLLSNGLTSVDEVLSRLESEGTPMAFPELLSQLNSAILPTGVAVVDSTASPVVAEAYPEILQAGISVVTPNKIALSSSATLFASIQSILRSDRSVHLLHESTVGAGLPIISTLHDLVRTGDKVHKIEGVLSGTLSYIFNNFSPATPSSKPEKFSAIVARAKELGYTEPNPHSDLSGSDVARKLTILARMLPEPPIPLPDGYLSVPTTSLSPAGLENLEDGDEYVRRLADHDDYFEKMRADAAESGSVLRYVGVLDVDNGIVKASLERYPVTHPFATSLGGSDNIIAFHTERYPRPLIVQGAGAGAAVTAMGVVSDLLKLTLA